MIVTLGGLWETGVHLRLTEAPPVKGTPAKFVTFRVFAKKKDQENRFHWNTNKRRVVYVQALQSRLLSRAVPAWLLATSPNREGHVAAARKRSHQWCLTLTPKNTETIEMQFYCFLRPIRRDRTSSSYTTEWRACRRLCGDWKLSWAGTRGTRKRCP